MQITTLKIADLSADPANVRKHDERNIETIIGSLRRFGQQVPIVVDKSNVVRAGNARLEAAKRIGWETIEAYVSDLTGSEMTAYAIVDNRSSELAEWDEEALAAVLEGLQFDDEALLEAAGFDEDELAELLKDIELDDEGGEGGTGSADDEPASLKLADRFGVAPFSVINAREGWWQDRKRAWLSLGIKSETGRDKELLGKASANSAYGKQSTGVDANGKLTYKESVGNTSTFDPVLCELAYRWFSTSGGIVLDPFAGGSVRGIVASKLGRRYVGIELRQEQVSANAVQGDQICSDPKPEWRCGDSTEAAAIAADIEADFVFSCPPYADLEVYSDDPKDLSTMVYADFIKAYKAIVAAACSRLRNDRFACFVVGDVRDKKGNYYNFVGDTVEAFRAAGLNLYNEAILVTCLGSKQLFAGSQFASGRKLGKTHQNVLVFVKGDGKKAATACGECDFADTDQAEMFGEVLA